jgi:hypothetical protein
MDIDPVATSRLRHLLLISSATHQKFWTASAAGTGAMHKDL